VFDSTRPKSWETRSPTRIISADHGLLSTLKNYVGDRILLITSRSHVFSEVILDLQNSLQNKTLKLISDISPNPTASEISRTCASLNSERWDSVVAIGGGSVIDTAKIVALYANSNSPPSRIDLLTPKSVEAIRRHCQLVVAPTTAGTGSEVTQFATVWDDLKNKKHSIDSSEIFPDVAILDPNLLKSMSPDLALFSCLDATAHCLETLWNRNRTIESESLARKGIALISEYFLNAHGRTWDVEHARNLQTAATFGGLAISISKTALSHSISYPLTSHLKIPHGLAVGFTLVANFEILTEESRSYVEKGLSLQKLISALWDLNLGAQILRFASRQQIFDLIPEMLRSERSANFVQTVDSSLVNRIISRSLE
jgi:alcohol dehydrogenase